jgi:hypothetical protein
MSELRAALDELVADQPNVVTWVTPVRRRIRRRKAGRILSISAALGLAAGAAPFAMSSLTGEDAVVTPAGATPRPTFVFDTELPGLQLQLAPAVSTLAVGQQSSIDAAAYDPQGTPTILGPDIDGDGLDVIRSCGDEVRSAGRAEQSFPVSFSAPGVHTVGVRAGAAACAERDVSREAIVDVLDSSLVLSNDITIHARILQAPTASGRELVLEVTTRGTSAHGQLSAVYVDGHNLATADRCVELGSFVGHPGTITATFRHRYYAAQVDHITLIASSYCTTTPGHARLDLDVTVSR